MGQHQELDNSIGKRFAPVSKVILSNTRRQALPSGSFSQLLKLLILLQL